MAEKEPQKANSAQIFEKVKNDTFQKLNALCAVRETIEKNLPFNQTRKVSIAEKISNKSTSARDFYTELSERDQCNSWESLFEALQREKSHPEIANLTDSIMAYTRTDPQVWLKLQWQLSEDNLDLASSYVLDGLKEMKIKEDITELDHEIIEHAEDVIERMQEDRERLRAELRKVQRESKDDMVQLEKELEEKNVWIKELRGELKEAKKERKEFEGILKTYKEHAEVMAVQFKEVVEKNAKQNEENRQKNDQMLARYERQLSNNTPEPRKSDERMQLHMHNHYFPDPGSPSVRKRNNKKN